MIHFEGLDLILTQTFDFCFAKNITIATWWHGGFHERNIHFNRQIRKNPC